MLKPGSEPATIRQNTNYLVTVGHSMEEAKDIANAYAQSAREFAGDFSAPRSYGVINPNSGNTAEATTQDDPEPKGKAVRADALTVSQTADGAFKVVGRGRMLIIKGAPTPVEQLRGEPFVNDDRSVLEKFVLIPLGCKREDVMLAWCDASSGGEEELEAFVKAANPDVIVCMSETTTLMKDKRSWNLPTLYEVRTELGKFADELVRKTLAIRKRLDVTAHRQAYSLQLVAKGATPTDRATIDTLIYKADPTERVVYGAVLDPYTVDTQDDWAPPKEIRKTAHEFLTKSGFVGLHHKEVAHDARTVESFIEDYPPGEIEKANQGLAHRVYARKYSTGQTIHSGSWVLGVQLSERLWKKYEAGEIAAFSMEGYGKRIPIDHRMEMPTVTFVELGEVGNARTGRTSDQTD